MKTPFESIASIAAGTPLYVWAILIYLLVIGIKATRDRLVYLPKLFIIPAVLIGLNVYAFLSNNHFSLFYPLFMTIGVFIGGIFSIKTPIMILKDLKSIKIPGGYSTLFILLLFFSIKYVFGYLQATNPETAKKYVLLATSIPALFSGYFLGRALLFIYRFRQG